MTQRAVFVQCVSVEGRFFASDVSPPTHVQMFFFFLVFFFHLHVKWRVYRVFHEYLIIWNISRILKYVSCIWSYWVIILFYYKRVNYWKKTVIFISLWVKFQDFMKFIFLNFLNVDFYFYQLCDFLFLFIFFYLNDHSRVNENKNLKLCEYYKWSFSYYSLKSLCFFFTNVFEFNKKKNNS